jgi:hypothetical protein
MKVRPYPFHKQSTFLESVRSVYVGWTDISQQSEQNLEVLRVNTKLFKFWHKCN